MPLINVSGDVHKRLQAIAKAHGSTMGGVASTFLRQNLTKAAVSGMKLPSDSRGRPSARQRAAREAARRRKKNPTTNKAASTSGDA